MYYDRVLASLLSNVAPIYAGRLAESLLLCQRIGTTGYIACVSSGGVMVVHPEAEWLGQDINRYDFVRQMREKRQGYIEYDWKNPGETDARPKAMYMAYFEPWDWIIAVSSYRKEFRTLVNIDDFRDSILSLRFSRSGYAFVTDSNGNVIIHPSLQGVNVIAAREFPNRLLDTMLKEKSGKIIYPWKNQGEPRMRDKLVIFNTLPEYEWIVASSSYLDEFYAPLDSKRNRMQLSVEDDGRGIPADVESDGMGLRIMGFRANMIHAVLEIHTPEDGGTVVQVFLSGNTAAPVDP